MKRIAQNFLPLFLLFLLLLCLYLLENGTRSKWKSYLTFDQCEYQKKVNMKSYLTFDQVLNQDLQLKGELSEVVPRHDSIFFVETSGKNHFGL